MRADGDESNTILALVVENGSVVAGDVDATTTCVWVMQEMIV